MARKISAQVEYRELASLKKHPRNPRTIKDKSFKQLIASINENPDYFEARPVILSDRTGDLIIIAGNQRYEASRDIGLKQIPTILLPALTEDKEREIMVRDNVANGDWDYDMLANEWDSAELNEWGLEVPDWDSKESGVGLTDADAAPEPEDDPVTVPGDLWLLGEHRLLCGDSAVNQDVIRLMNGQLADMCLTDPPYGVSYVGKTKDALTVENDSLTPDELKIAVKKWFDCVDSACRNGAYLIATVPAKPLHIIFASDWNNRGWLRQIMVWNKDSMVLGHSEYHYKHEPILFGWKPGDRLKNTDRTKTTVWDFDRPKRSLEHPTMKPVEMWEYATKNHTKQGDLLFEPFSGSGTTHIACEKTGRKCYGIELSPQYCDVIIKRWQDFTGQQATLEATGETYEDVKHGRTPESDH